MSKCYTKIVLGMLRMVLVSFVDGLDNSQVGKYKAKNQEKRELRYQQCIKVCEIEEK